MKKLSPTEAPNALSVFVICLLTFNLLLTPIAAVAASTTRNSNIRSEKSESRSNKTATENVFAKPSTSGPTLPGPKADAAPEPMAPLTPAAVSATMSAAIVNDDGDTQLDPTNGQANTEKLTYTTTLSNTTAGDATGLTFTDTLDTHTTLVNGTLNSTPVAFDQKFPPFNEDASAQNIILSGQDPDGSNLTFSIVTSPTRGTLDTTNIGTVNCTNGVCSTTISYTPNANDNGSDSFTFKVNDGTSDSNQVGTVSITINPVNDPPTFTPGSNQTVNEDAGPQSVSSFITNVSPGPPNESSQTVDFVISNYTHHALFSTAPSINVSGSTATLTYTPAAYANGTSTITYHAHDNGGTANGGVDHSADQNFTITVNAVNDPPVAQPKTFTIQANMKITGLTGLLTGATDPDATNGANDPLSFDAGYTPTFTITHNSLTLQSCAGATISNVNESTGTFDFDPPPGLSGNGVCTLNYKVTDSGNPGPGVSSANATITININGPVIWFVDLGAANNGNGTLSNTSVPSGIGPFNNLADANTKLQNLGTNDRIFLYTTDNTKTQAALNSQVILQSTQGLIGQAATDNQGFDHFFGINPPAGTAIRPSINSATRTKVRGVVTMHDNTVVNGVDIDVSAANAGTKGLTSSFTGGTSSVVDVSVTSAGGNAVDISGTQTFTYTGSSNVLSSTTGTALRVANTTIGASGLTFRSISATGSSNNSGIILDNTGTSGSLTVSGNGGTCSSTPNSCTGGTISNKTGNDILTGTDAGGQTQSGTNGCGIFLRSTSNPQFNNMQLNDFSNFGIYGTSVTGFTLANSRISGANGSNNAGDREEDSIRFDGLFTSASFPTVSITGNNISGGFTENLRLENVANNSTLNRISITNNTWGFVNASNGNHNVLLIGYNNATVNVTFQDNTVLGARSELFETSAQLNSTMDVVVRHNDFQNGQTLVSGGGGIAIRGDSAGTAAHVTFDVSCNKINGANTTAFFIDKGNGSGTYSGAIVNNKIGTAGQAGSGASNNGDAMFIREAGSGTLTILIRDNVINQWTNGAISLQNNAGSATMNASLFHNTATQAGSGAFAVVDVENGAQNSDTSTTNVVIGSAGTAGDKNSIHDTTGSVVTDVELSNFGANTHLNLYKNGSGSSTISGVLSDDNNSPAPTSDTSGGSGTTALQTGVPTAPTTPASCTVVAMLTTPNAKRGDVAQAIGEIGVSTIPAVNHSTVIAKASAFAEVFAAKVQPRSSLISTAMSAVSHFASTLDSVIEPTTFAADSTGVRSQESGAGTAGVRSQESGVRAQRSDVRLNHARNSKPETRDSKLETRDSRFEVKTVAWAVPLTPPNPPSGTITINGTGSGFTLPAGKTITITYTVTLNNPPGLSGPTSPKVSNHGTLQGGFTNSPLDTNTVDTTVDLFDSKTTLTPGSQSVNAGQSVTFTAVVAFDGATAPPSPAGGTTPTGTVDFFDNGSITPIAGCAGVMLALVSGQKQAQCTTSFTSGGHSITATYNGDGNFDPKTSAASVQTVSKSDTTTTVQSSKNPSSVNDLVTFTATVASNTSFTGPPTGTVSFKDNGSPLTCSNGATDTQTLSSGSATCQFTYINTTGSPHTITAAYSGDSNFNASDNTGAPLMQTVNSCVPNPVVLNTNDSGAGSLRQAIIDACDAATITFDSGAFASPGPYTIKLLDANGELLVNKNLTITGPGANVLTVKRDDAAATNFRVFEISPSKTVTITDMTVSNGKAPNGTDDASSPTAGANGGAILNAGTLTLTNMVVSSNNAGNGGNNTGSGAGAGGGFGGGLYNGSNATLTINSSTISGNQAGAGGTGTPQGFGGPGGGVYSIGNLTIDKSTFNGNKAVALNAEGGGIDSEGGTLAITNSTISGNMADGNGGGLLNCGTSTATLTSVTITGNTSDHNNDANGDGGGIAQVSSNTLTIDNTIVAGNFKGTPSAKQAETLTVPGGATNTGDILLTVTAANMNGSQKSVLVTVTAGDSASTVAGKIQTALAADSTVGGFFDITTNNADVILTVKTPAANDSTMHVHLSGNATGIQNADSTPSAAGSPSSPGTQQAETITVGSGVSSCGGSPTVQVVVTAANMTGSQVTLHVTVGSTDDAATVAGDIITFIANDPSAANVKNFFNVTSGGGAALIFTAKAAAANDPTMHVAIGSDSCTITSSDSSPSATGIAPSNGTQQQETVAVSGGPATHSGTIYVTVTGAALGGNSPKTVSVPISNGDSNDTVAGEIATALNGDGIVSGSFTASNSNANVTLTANAAAANDPTMHVSIIGASGINDAESSPSAAGITPNDIFRSFTANISASSFNLIGDAATSGGLTDGTDNNIVGNTGSGTRDIATILNTTLADNGGPTKTHALVDNSPALDNGKAFSLTTDQRGFPRPVDLPDNTYPNATGGDASDIGAFERQITPAAPSTPTLASDTGAADGHVTGNTNPSIAIGGVTSGATVNLFRDGNQVASGVAGGSSITLADNSGLAEGTYSYTAKQTVGGLQSNASGALSVIIDTTGPSTNIGSPSTANANAATSTVTYTVTYTDPNFNSSTLTAGNITLNHTGTANASIGVSGSGNTRTVTLSSLTGTGTLGISVASGTATDLAGNLATASGASSTFNLDANPPVVSSITRVDTNPTAATTVHFTVTFSQAVTGVNIGQNSDFVLTTTGAVSGASITNLSGSGTTYTVTVSTGTGDGTIRLDVTDDDSIVDAAGNPLGGTGAGNGNFTTGEVYLVDRENPYVVSINRAGSNPTNASNVNFTVTFSKPVTGVDKTDFTLTTTGVTSPSINSVSGSSDTYTVNVLTGTGDGTIRLDLVDDNSIVDAGGRPLGAPHTTGASDGSFNTGQVYTIDKTAPTVTSLVKAAGQLDPAIGPTASTVINFTATFSEPVVGFTPSGVQLSGSAGATIVNISQVAPNDGTTYNLAVEGMTQSGGVTVKVLANAASDPAGNGNTVSGTATVQFLKDNFTAFEVNSTADTDDGSCDPLDPNDATKNCTLREAINAANADFGAETITFNSTVFDPNGGPYTINLTGALPDITEDVTIQGPGANVLTVKRNTGGNYRIFNVTTNGVVTFSGLTISNGNVAGNGGGIQNVNSGTVNITNCAVSGNTAGGAGQFTGGGIASNNGTVSVTNSTVSGNTVSVTGTSSLAFGGGIYIGGGTLNVTNSTVSGNTASSSGTSSKGQGGGIYINSGTATIVSGTIASNTSASTGTSSSNTGGGVYVFGGTVTLKNTIVGNNTATASPDLFGTVQSDGFNLVQNNSGATINQNGGAGPNITGQDPQLKALGNNGGPTQTHALQCTSPAIDKGNAFTLTTDQRGRKRPFDLADSVYPDAVGGDGSDIGAFETQTGGGCIPTAVPPNPQPSMNEDASVPITLTGTYSQNHALSFTVTQTPAHGTLDTTTPTANCTLGTSTTCTATVNYSSTDFNGVDSFAFKVSAGALDSEDADVNITINLVNDRPSFTKGPDQTVLVNSGPQSVANWATNISPGPPNESGQALNFIVNNNNNALFSMSGQPAIDPTGTLTFTPALNAFGSAMVTVQLHDNGGTANGGIDTSDAQTFMITVKGAILGTKSFSGDTFPGSTITYTVSLNNVGFTDQMDNPGDEFTDVLPTTLTLVSADASGGVATADVPNRTVHWNGPIAAGDSVTVIIKAKINTGTEGQTISNTGTIHSDADNNGTNETTTSTNTVSFTVCPGTLVVTNTNDGGPGSLRQTIADACQDATITFSSTTAGGATNFFDGNPHTITLTSGEIAINKNVIIQGPATASLAISGNNTFRVFNVHSDDALTISNLTITGGKVTGNNGGAIYSLGNLTILNSTFTGNSAVASGGNGGSGGAIDSDGGTLTIINSTISGNAADAIGGGVLNSGDSLGLLTNVTITNNRSDNDNDGNGDGGGVAQLSGADLTLNNTLVAGNFKGTGTTPNDFFVDVVDFSFIDASSSHNLIGVNTGLSNDISNGTNGNQIGTAASPINPLMRSLASNGGPTQTHLLLPGSPARNVGDTSLAKDQNGAPLTTDQRGAGFVRFFGSSVDIGAFETGYSIDITAGSPQSTPINTAFGTALKATVKESGMVQSGLGVTFTAPASGPSGAFSGSATVTTDGSGVATAPTFTANGKAGNYNVTATMVGAPSHFVNFSLTNTANSSTAVGSSPNPSQLAQSVTFTATLTSPGGIPTGTVQFKDGVNNLGSPAALNGNGVAQLTTASLTAGTHTITAVYGGDGVFQPSTGTLSGGQVVNNRPLVNFSASNYPVNEADGSVQVLVNRTGDTSVAFNVDFATDDTGASIDCSKLNTTMASSRCDYTTMVGTLKFAAGETSKPINIPINADSYTEGPESFTINLSNTTGAAFLITPFTATVTINDSPPPAGVANAIDDSPDFVRQQYHDFLNRDADPPGLAFWVNNIEQCNNPANRQPGQTAQQCKDVQRVLTSGAFFLSIEFMQTGNFVRSFYVAALNRPVPTLSDGKGFNNMPALNEWMKDTEGVQRDVVVGQGNWQATLDANRLAFMQNFVMRGEFLGLYPTTDAPTIYINKLYNHALGRLPSAAELSDALSVFGGAATASDPTARGQALLKVTQTADFMSRELPRAFVQMQYFGYLRRNPNDLPDTDFTGYNFWLAKLVAAGGDFQKAEMVRAFITSFEYRHRFGSQ